MCVHPQEGGGVPGGHSCDIFFWVPKRRGGVSHLIGSHSGFLGIDKDENKTVPCYGDFKEGFKGYTWYKCNMLSLVNTTDSVIEDRNWVGVWLEVFV